MRVLGFPLESPQAIVNRALADLGAVARAARTAPAQLERMLQLGEEMADIGRGVLEIAERLDQRADAALALGERLDARADELLKLGRKMEKLGKRVDKRGGEIVERGDEIVASAGRVAETGSDLIGMLPTLQRAIEMASPLEGAIDRVGRLVDRLPGGQARRTDARLQPDATEVATEQQTSTPLGESPPTGR
jgi:hypothetical protein